MYLRDRDPYYYPLHNILILTINKMMIEFFTFFFSLYASPGQATS